MSFMFVSKTVDELWSYSGGKKLDPLSPIQFSPLNDDASEEPQFRRILSGTLMGSQVIKWMNGKTKKRCSSTKLMMPFLLESIMWDSIMVTQKYGAKTWIMSSSVKLCYLYSKDVVILFCDLTFLY